MSDDTQDIQELQELQELHNQEVDDQEVDDQEVDDQEVDDQEVDGDAFDDAVDEMQDQVEDEDTTNVAKETKEQDVVNYPLEQTDDEPRDDEHPALSVAAIKEHIKSGSNWADYFDPQTGFIPTPAEDSVFTTPSKIFTVVPYVKGSKKNPEPVIENGKQVYKPKASVRNFPVGYNSGMVKDVLGGVFNDAVSKYILDCFLKPFNKSVMNEHYGRKMPTRAFNAPFKISLDVVEATSGITFEDHLHSLLRTGWFTKTASVRQFEMSVMCDTPEKLEAILAQKGSIISKWKPSDFPAMMGTVNTFKKVGKIVSDNLTYKRAPQSRELYAVLDCISSYTERFNNSLMTIEQAEQDVEANLKPAEILTDKIMSVKEGCITQLGHWATVTCGLEGLAKQLQEAENKKLAKAAKSSESEDMLDSLDELLGDDFADLSTEAL